MIEAAKEEIFPSLPAWCADPASAARMVNPEKSHQGIAPQNPALNPGIVWSNSTTALGMRGLGWENRVRSRCTGKERDAESGLDNFGARYNASTMGRFMTPDPLHIMKQKLIDPQQWNMYAYVRNNPLRFTDPFGMFTCSGNKDFCGRVKAAYDQIQKAAAAAEKGSDQQKQLNKILKFLGKPGEANYVSVKAGSLSAGELGKADTSTSTDLQGSRHTTTQITLDFSQADTTAKLRRGTPLLGTEAQDDAGVFGHEGTHGLDQFPLGHNPETRTQEHATEMNAYRNQSYIYTELGFKSVLDPGLSADTEAQRNQAISAGADRSTAAWCEEGGGCN